MFDTLFGNLTSLTSLGTFAVIGTNEILMCAGVVVLLFGGTKLSQLGKGLGEGIREFKASLASANANAATNIATTAAINAPSADATGGGQSTTPSPSALAAVREVRDEVDALGHAVQAEVQGLRAAAS
jgi:sec-independent protein translocase protein TatA